MAMPLAGPTGHPAQLSLVALALALACGTMARAAQDADAPPDIAAGAALFAQHCAWCHGPAARGDGAEAGRLNPPPADLTSLTLRYDGAFPVARVVSRIDGREPIVAHGSPMPVFGEFFDGEDAFLKTGAGQPVLTSRPIADLVGWLENIQEKTP
jgi:mono/diheme cytochrome c family protein